MPVPGFTGTGCNCSQMHDGQNRREGIMYIVYLFQLAILFYNIAVRIQ